MKNGKQAGEQLVFQPELFFTNELSVKAELCDSLAREFQHCVYSLRDRERILIFFESLGGHFLPAEIMYNTLLNSKNKTIGISGKKIVSFAGLVFQGFKLRLIRKETVMFLHNLTQRTTFEFMPFETDRPKSHEFLNLEFDEAERQQRFFYRVFSTSTGLSETEIIELFTKQAVLSAKEIISLNLADGFYPDDLP
jgi:ATP-dependent protease ClpP protease subunit